MRFQISKDQYCLAVRSAWEVQAGAYKGSVVTWSEANEGKEDEGKDYWEGGLLG